MTRPLRFFYVPNETKEGDQVGPRKAFETLHAEGVFSAYATYSYLVERGFEPIALSDAMYSRVTG